MPKRRIYGDYIKFVVASFSKELLHDICDNAQHAACCMWSSLYIWYPADPTYISKDMELTEFRLSNRPWTHDCG